MINYDTPEELNNFKDLKNEGRSSVQTIKFDPSKLLVASLINYSLALEVIKTSENGNFFVILN